MDIKDMTPLEKLYYHAWLLRECLMFKQSELGKSDAQLDTISYGYVLGLTNGIEAMIRRGGANSPQGIRGRHQLRKQAREESKKIWSSIDAVKFIQEHIDG